MMQIPYAAEERPDTGLYNAKLGMWLFIASEAMLFAGLISGYILLRSGADQWPAHQLALLLPALNTAILITSSMTMVTAWASLREGDWDRHRRSLATTAALGTTFLVIKLIEYARHIRSGEGPAHDTFFGLYYALTGLHALHIAGGLVAMVYFLGPGRQLWQQSPAQFTNRIEATGLYWHFVDFVWLFLFALLYLI
ncbi:MAG: heme-copper oxidase subunit III [Vicinamibacterales bacterium]